MVVGENYRGRTRNDRSTEDLARMDNGRVEDPSRDYGWTLSDQLMLAVQRQNPERTGCAVRRPVRRPQSCADPNSAGSRRRAPQGAFKLTNLQVAKDQKRQACERVNW